MAAFFYIGLMEVFFFQLEDIGSGSVFYIDHRWRKGVGQGREAYKAGLHGWLGREAFKTGFHGVATQVKGDGSIFVFYW